MPSMAQAEGACPHNADETPNNQIGIATQLLIEHREALARIDRAGRHVIAAAWNAGMSERAIAEVLGWSKTPVRERLSRAEGEGQIRRPRGVRGSRNARPVTTEAGASAEIAEG